MYIDSENIVLIYAWMVFPRIHMYLDYDSVMTVTIHIESPIIPTVKMNEL